MTRLAVALLALAALATGCGAPATASDPGRTAVKERQVKLTDGRTITCLEFGDPRYTDAQYAVSCDWSPR